MMDYTKIKLVIWDLDDTFWNGTLSEEKPIAVKENICIVKQLAERGIVSSICSKNDLDQARKVLIKMGIWDYFVFPSINWEPKGQRIAQIVQSMSLRPVNVLFIDDRLANLQEAKYFSPGLMTAFPKEALPELTKKANTLGKDDRRLSRLHQYQMLEKKHTAAAKASSNEDFLRSCHVQVSIRKDCIENIERLEELIQRSNQLNYTKLRMDCDALEEYLRSTRYDSAYVIAKDDFGSYGIVGFYTLDQKENRLIHFLFSCRTMGMGIEQYIFSKLHFPTLDVVGEVATELHQGVEPPDWITETALLAENDHRTENGRKLRILFKGSCDTESSLAFLKAYDGIDTEFTFVNSKGYVISSHNSTYHILQSLPGQQEAVSYRGAIPFWDEQLYKTRMFTEHYDIVFLSVFKDAVSGLYESRRARFPYVFDDWFVDATNSRQWERYTKDMVAPIKVETMRAFAEQFKYKGRIPQTAIVENVKKIRERLPETTLLVISIPTSYPYLDRNESRKNDRHIYNQVLAKELKAAFAQQENVALIDYTDFANQPGDFLDTSNHFTKQVYYRVAQEYIHLIKEWSGTDQVISRRKGAIAIVSAKDWVRKILRHSKILVRIKRKMGALYR